ncbi:MAG TPA: thioredoxin domain-containing protein [Candidatus Acidoferrum sp.]|nr:thioredoxin domain-containing protein [Candidatus Acidoferrum sp.]
MPSQPLFPALAALLLCALVSPPCAARRTPSQASNVGPKEKSSAKPPSPDEELQRALGDAGSDRAALVRNLEGFLLKYPDYPNRTSIYRALVEASLQLKDNARAADYSERMASLNPNDISILLLAIELLERQEDQAGFRRAVSYSTRILDLVERMSPSERSPRVSVEQWEQQKKSDLANTHFLRGDLYFKLKDYDAARKDLQTSYEIFASAGAAQRLGETAELQKDLDTAIVEYARAFALEEGKSGNASREEIRKKIGNVWRLAHSSENGLGEYLLDIYDAVTRPAVKKPARNGGVKEFSEFTLRKAVNGAPYALKETKGKVVVLNFWATWCGPCHALEPLFAHVAADLRDFPEALFLSANCDEDETLVAPYLQKDRVTTEVVFADGLDRLFSVNSFPTVIVIDRQGKIAFRSDGFQPDTFERDLSSAVRRALDKTDAPPRDQ